MSKYLRKELIIGFILGIVLSSGITVYAYNYLATEIAYTRQGTDIKNVEEALNDLYDLRQAKVIENFTCESNGGVKKHYDIGFEPSVVVIVFDNGEAINVGIKGKEYLLVRAAAGAYIASIDGSFSTEANGFSMINASGSDITCTLYAFK